MSLHFPVIASLLFLKLGLFYPLAWIYMRGSMIFCRSISIVKVDLGAGNLEKTKRCDDLIKKLLAADRNTSFVLGPSCHQCCAVEWRRNSS